MTEVLNIHHEAIEDFYDIAQEIGSGQFAVVKKLSEKASGKEFAAKFMKKKRAKSLRLGMTSEQILREANVLRSINHKGIIYLHDIFETKLEFILVLELLSGGELFEFLSEQEYLTEDEAVGFLKQVIEAIEYLHQRSIVHLDIKPENIVLKSEGSTQIKLIDFGLARELAKGEMVREIMGTPEFVAPEIIAFEPVGTETDMWAIGVLTYIMLSGASPFLGDSDTETFNNISHVDYEFDDEYFKDLSSSSKEFISDLLLKNPRDRMSAEECLKHEWLQEQDDNVDSLATSKSEASRSEAKTRRSTLIKTEAFKKFTARARWQKSVNKLIAISRFALLSKKNGPLNKGVLLQPTESDTSSDTENNNESQSIPLDRLEDSDRESTAESTNDDESECFTDSPRTADEKSEEIAITTENGSENERKRLQDKENKLNNDEEKELINKITTPESKDYPKSKSSEEISDSLKDEKVLDQNQSEIRKEQKKPDRQEKPVLPVAKPVQPVSKSLVKEKADRQEEKPVLPVAKPVQPVSKSSVKEKPDLQLKKPDLPEHVQPVSKSSDVKTDAKQSATQLKVTTERRRFYENTGDVMQKSSQIKSKINDIRNERKQEDAKSKSKFLFHDKNKEDKAAKKLEPTKMKSGKFESLLSKFSKPHAASQEDSKKKKYAKEARRLTSGSVKNNRIKNEFEFEEPRTRRKSDQMGSRINWQAIRGGTDERLKTAESLKTSQQTKRSDGLARSSEYRRETTGKAEGLTRITTSDDKTKLKSTTLEKPSAIEKTLTTSVIKTEIPKSTSSKSFDNGALRNQQDDASVWVRRATTSLIEERSKGFRSNRRGVLGLSHTSAKAEVMKWEQRQNNEVDSSPRRPRSSPLKPMTDRPLVREWQKTSTSVHNTTVTVNTKDTRKVPSVELGTAVKDKEHTLLVQTSPPPISESQSEVFKKRKDSGTNVKTEERKVNHSETHGNEKPLVENAGKYRNVVENPQNESRKTENKSSKHKKDKERSEIKTEIQSGNTSAFPEFDLTFQKIVPVENDAELPVEDDDFIWVMTSETNPNLELLVSPTKKSKSHSKVSRRRSTKSSEADTEPSVRENSGGRRRSTKSSEADTEPSAHVDSGRGRRSTKSSEADTGPSVTVDSGRRRRSTKSSEADTEPSVRENSDGRRRSIKSSEADTEPSVTVDSGRRRRSTKSNEADTEPSVLENSGGRRRSAKSFEVENETAVFESSSSTRNKNTSVVEVVPTVRLASGNTKLIDDASSDTPLQVKTIPMTSGVTTVNFEINTGKFKLK
ncbi:serine/threonine-protein kinase HSL1-like isoform X3 [Actinia tenebrosa]|uniref:Serine/threonine-protein kinase HSL1-like isoform X3 n=1 Tax=Actinia tenebrosa TaxID=6105 RepID=A0A6P8IH39_ACTTE|nr:serine/threonine-protein kinase HSL1-like isoform X3 [Actinia tenebrosa]